MDSPDNPQNSDNSEELTTSADQQLEERLAEATKTPSPLRTALGLSGSGDGIGKP